MNTWNWRAAWLAVAGVAGMAGGCLPSPEDVDDNEDGCTVLAAVFSDSCGFGVDSGWQDSGWYPVDTGSFHSDTGGISGNRARVGLDRWAPAAPRVDAATCAVGARLCVEGPVGAVEAMCAAAADAVVFELGRGGCVGSPVAASMLDVSLSEGVRAWIAD